MPFLNIMKGTNRISIWRFAHLWWVLRSALVILPMSMLVVRLFGWWRLSAASPFINPVRSFRELAELILAGFALFSVRTIIHSAALVLALDVLYSSVFRLVIHCYLSGEIVLPCTEQILVSEAPLLLLQGIVAVIIILALLYQIGKPIYLRFLKRKDSRRLE